MLTVVPLTVCRQTAYPGIDIAALKQVIGFVLRVEDTVNDFMCLVDTQPHSN